MKLISSNAVAFRRNAAAPALAIATTPWVAPSVVSRGHPEPNPANLTPRQLEVLALLCEGLPNKLICRRLNIATGTVKVHISCILRELGVTSRLQAVVAAGSLGLAAKLGGGTPDAIAGTTSAAHAVTLAHPLRATAPTLSAVAA